jgi:hypothetical protein
VVRSTTAWVGWSAVSARERERPGNQGQSHCL